MRKEEADGTARERTREREREKLQTEDGKDGEKRQARRSALPRT